MTDEELVRRGEVREFLQQCGLMGNHPSDPLAVMFNEIAAAQPTVSSKQLAAQPDDVAALERILRERGAVFDAMVDAAEDAAGKDVSFNVVVGRALRAAIAEIKGESHD